MAYVPPAHLQKRLEEVPHQVMDLSARSDTVEACVETFKASKHSRTILSVAATCLHSELSHIVPY
jgi:hypothetical protein